MLKAMGNTIPYSRQKISKEDIESVKEVLESDFLTQGPIVPIFEKKVSDIVGAQYGVAVNSATSALHIACLALGLSSDDYLWTSANSFVASANCGLYCGSKVSFIDIDPNTYNISLEALKMKLVNAEKNNLLPKVIVTVDFAGQSCQMDEIKKLSEKYKFKIIEDASHAIGGKYRDAKIGSCKFSDITIFSFHPVKIITTGEGGMALTNDSELAELMSQFRSHGITRNKELMKRKDPELYHYEQINLGFNYRMSDIVAALGISQLSQLVPFVEKRNQIAKKYNELLIDLPLKLPTIKDECFSSFHLYVVRLMTEKCSITHKELFHTLRNRGIGVNLHYEPIHLHPYYANMGFKRGDYPESEKFSSEAISLPIYVSLSDSEQNQVVNHLYEIIY